MNNVNVDNVKDRDLGTTQYLRARVKAKFYKTLGGKRNLCRLQSLRFAPHFDRLYYLSFLFPSYQKFRFYPLLLHKLLLPDLHFLPYSRTLSDPLRPCAFYPLPQHPFLFYYISTFNSIVSTYIPFATLRTLQSVTYCYYYHSTFSSSTITSLLHYYYQLPSNLSPTIPILYPFYSTIHPFIYFLLLLQSIITPLYYIIRPIFSISHSTLPLITLDVILFHY